MNKIVAVNGSAHRKSNTRALLEHTAAALQDAG